MSNTNKPFEETLPTPMTAETLMSEDAKTPQQGQPRKPEDVKPIRSTRSRYRRER